MLGELPAGRIRTVALDDPAVVRAVERCPDIAPAVDLATGSLAYVVYTSGSD